jgi:hypothetical protein
MPGSDKALIYIFGYESSNPFNLNSYTSTFAFHGKIIGSLSKKQYLYVYAKPMGIAFRGKNGGALNVNIEAGKTYFFQIRPHFFGEQILYGETRLTCTP